MDRFLRDDVAAELYSLNKLAPLHDGGGNCRHRAGEAGGAKGHSRRHHQPQDDHEATDADARFS